MDITLSLLREFGVGEEMIEHIPHRKGHDFRYDVDGEKLKKLGYDSSRDTLLKDGLQKTVEWYRNNPDWWRPLKK